jgi:hypothetical protein
MSSPLLTAPLRSVQHLGALHGAEGALVLLLAFGPLTVAFLTVFWLRWRGEQEA